MSDSLEIGFTVVLTEEAMNIFNQMPSFPNNCPACGFTHPSALWVRCKDKDVFICDRCQYMLKDSDVWHTVIQIEN